jgi:ribosomal protein S27AE
MPDLLDRLPGGYVIAKDLSVSKSLVPGNPFCRYKTDDQSRKYCSKDLWLNADEKYVIPEDGTIPRPHVDCGSCGHDSWVTDADECGRCGEPIFVCPNKGCDEEVHGKPESCPACNVGYNWPDKDDGDAN